MPSGSTVHERSVRLPFPAEAVFAWHTRPGALERLTPPWEHVQVIERSGGIEDGGRVVMKVGAPFGLRWVARHRDYQPGRQFTCHQSNWMNSGEMALNDAGTMAEAASPALA